MAKGEMIYRFSLDVYIYGLENGQLLVVEGETFRHKKSLPYIHEQDLSPKSWLERKELGMSGITIEPEEGFWSRHPNRSWEQ